MGTAATSDTTITTEYYTDVAAVDQQQETPGDAGNTEGAGRGSMAVIIGGAVGGVLLIALAAALFVKRFKTSSSNSSGAYEEKAIKAPGDRTKTHSIDCKRELRKPYDAGRMRAQGVDFLRLERGIWHFNPPRTSY
jgi:hypothetical protein